MSSSGYRPAQWSSIKVPLTLLVPSIGPAPGLTGVFIPVTILYVFDGVIRQEHRQRMTITRNPVQTGASLTDHAFLEPAEVTAEILMSDAMQSFVSGQFSGNSSRSISAYQTLLAIQASAAPIQLATRLNQYSNMLITQLDPDDTAATAYGLRAVVTFTQIITADVAINPSGSSSRSDATQTTPGGSAQTQTPSLTIQQQHDVSSYLSHAQTELPDLSSVIPGMNVPAAGSWSSTNVNALPAQ